MTEQICAEPAEASGEATLSLHDVTVKIGCSKRSVYNFMQTRGFPRPVNVGRPRWSASEVDAWLAAETGRSDPPTPTDPVEES